MKATTKPETVEYIQWTGDNLKEVLNFTGKHPRFNEWFSSLEEFEEHVKNDGKVFKLFHKKHHQKAKVGCFIVRNENGRNIVFTESEFHATYDIEPVIPWISVNNALPDKKHEWYLISSNCNVPHESLVTMAFLDSNGCDGEAIWLVHNDGYRCESDEWDNVTHWMPLPPAPEVKESE